MYSLAVSDDPPSFLEYYSVPEGQKQIFNRSKTRS